MSFDPGGANDVFTLLITLLIYLIKSRSNLTFWERPRDAPPRGSDAMVLREKAEENKNIL